MKVLRIVDGDKNTMGFLYEAMDSAKEAIQHLYRSNETKFRPIWNIIDCRWNQQLHQHIHADAYFLNPKYYFSNTFKADAEVQIGLDTCIRRLLLIRTFETSYLMSCRAIRGKRGHCFLLLIANVGDTPCSQVKNASV